MNIVSDFEFYVSIYDNVAGVPGSELYNKALIAPMPLEYEPGKSYSGHGWYGWDNINVELTPGTYWVGFKGNEDGASPHAIAASPAEFPLGNYSSFDSSNGKGWVDADYLRTGMVVEGVPTTP